jgi:hypothetical protein
MDANSNLIVAASALQARSCRLISDFLFKQVALNVCRAHCVLVQAESVSKFSKQLCVLRVQLTVRSLNLFYPICYIFSRCKINNRQHEVLRKTFDNSPRQLFASNLGNFLHTYFSEK